MATRENTETVSLREKPPAGRPPPQVRLELQSASSTPACWYPDTDGAIMDTERGMTGMATVDEKIELLKEIRDNPERYLPVVDHVWRVFPKKNMGTEWYDDPEYNLGWDVGLLEGNRPYFMECWATCGITIVTYFISAEGIGDATAGDLETMLTDGAKLLRFLSPDHRHVSAKKFTDTRGNEFFSVNITVGDEEGTYVDGAVSYPFSPLNELNKKTEKEGRPGTGRPGE